ncbi:MAG TPA: NAD(P)H-binding protein [Jiangellales bacterium]|nr:NAD(P)H-binding protein [Jiangellales bacterium]
MNLPILITGGTGTLGRRLLPMLETAGPKLRVLSRRGHESTDRVEYVTGDLATGEGVEQAVDGVGTIVHLAGSSTGDDVKTRTLVDAAGRAGKPHVVYISVVGADRVPVVSRVDRAMFGYFASKLAAEEVITGSGLPWTTLRATQFHDLVFATVRQMAKLPVVPVPSGVRFQPVDTGEVAARLVELAVGEPSGLVPDLAGPRVYEIKDLIRSYLQAKGKRRLLVPARLPGTAARAMRDGANLAPDRAVGRRSWEDFLAEKVS